MPPCEVLEGTSLAPRAEFKQSNCLRERLVQNPKQATSHSCSVQVDPKVPKGKDYSQMGMGIPGCTALYSLGQEHGLLLQRPVSISQQKAKAGCERGVGRDRQVPETSKFCFCLKIPIDPPQPSQPHPAPPRRRWRAEPRGSDSCLDAQPCPPS